MKKCRVWTKDTNGYTCHTEWQTWNQCKKYIKGRWGLWYSWAYISSAKDTANFIRYNGI